jgi:ketosteroid isomerase-like protein
VYVLLGLLAAALVPQKLSPAALNEMVETERAFAAMGAEKGVRESFFEFFGEEGISFNPHPAKFREYARKNPLPDPPPPREFKLEWWPVYGDVAESGDLGYNTGPTLFTDLTPQNRSSGHGYFFSVWKKRVDGAWRVAVDMGAESPGPDPAHQDRLRYERAPQEPTQKAPPRDAAQGRSEILELESRFRETLMRQGMRDGYLSAVGERARLHRVKTFPMLGKKAIGDYFNNRKLTVVEWEGIDGGVAASGELGYSYGRYELAHLDNGGDRSEKGYFTHVWKRDGNGEWKLVADVTNSLPKVSSGKSKTRGRGRREEIGR